MGHLIAAPAQTSGPLLGSLVGGFAMLVIGLAVLTVGRHGEPVQSGRATRRALLYALVYGLCFASFARLIGAAIAGTDRSPLLLALGDVIFVTLGLYIWVMVLAEGHPLRDLGFRGVAPGRLALTGFMGLGVVAFYGWVPFQRIAAGQPAINADLLVFAGLFASLGSALPDEILFRGYLMSSLSGRARLWARVALSAVAFALVRSMRVAPALGLGTPAWLVYVVGAVLPLGLWWGLMRELAGGSIWPGLVSHFLLEFGNGIAGLSPEAA